MSIVVDPNVVLVLHEREAFRLDPMRLLQERKIERELRWVLGRLFRTNLSSSFRRLEN